MHRRQLPLLLPLLAAGTVASACSRPEEAVRPAAKPILSPPAMDSGSAPSIPVPTDLGQALEGMKALQRQAAAPKRAIIAFQKLTPLLPDAPPGWKAQPTEGRTVTMGAFTVSEATRHYARGHATLTATVQDMAQNPALALATLAFSLTEDSTNGYQHPYTAGDLKGTEKWVKASKRAEITAFTPNQIMLQVQGAGLDGPEVVKELFGKLDVATISALQP